MVKIDMEMPKCCWECRFCVFKHFVPGFFCVAYTGENFIDKRNLSKRLKICPLKECDK